MIIDFNKELKENNDIECLNKRIKKLEHQFQDLYDKININSNK